MLFIFFGNIGTGKTSLARKVAEKLNCELVHFDNIVWLVLNKDKVYGENDKFLISMDETLKVYHHMHTLARFLLQQGRKVVLESMYFKKQRDEAISLAKDMKVPYILVEVTCDENEIKERLEKRKQEDPQTPGFNLYMQYRDMLEKEDSDHIAIDTSNKSIEESADELIGILNSKNLT